MVKQIVRKIIIFCVAAILLGGILLSGRFLVLAMLDSIVSEENTNHLGPRSLGLEKTEKALSPEEISDSDGADAETAPAPDTADKTGLPTTDARRQVNQSPPKQAPTRSIDVVKQSGNGLQTVIVAEGGTSTQADFERIASLSNSSSDPYGVAFSDETGRHAGLENSLKDYLNSVLRWGDEITSLKEIIVRDAGESGWNGQYHGSYIRQSDGDIISASGYLILNVHYYEDSDFFADYMKLILAHEYGHHYTLYYKWVNGDSPAGERFPDSYYSIRPLSREKVTPLCDNGWESCEPEVIAEDYSYIYSGYNYHAFLDIYGLPSVPATKEWLDNIAENVKQAVAPNLAPTVAIASPVDGSTVDGEIVLSVTAEDDKAVSRVVFSIDGTDLGEDDTLPYQFIMATAGYPDGNHALKVQAYDESGLSAEQTINITIYNQIPDTVSPVITITGPATNPYVWESGDLVLTAQATDNKEVEKIEIYINDSLAATENAAGISRLWRRSSGTPGSYAVKFKAYDKTGNFGEQVLQVEKQ